MGVSRKKVERLTDAARVFTFLALAALCYLAIGITRGLDNPEKRAELAARLLAFSVPDGYHLSSAVHMAISRFVVVANDSRGQRIRISQTRLGSDRRPEGFRDTYFHVGESIRRHRNLGGFDRIVVSATGEITVGGHLCPLVRGTFQPGNQEGEVILLRCPKTGRSHTIVASAPEGAYSEEETRALLATVRCHPEVSSAPGLSGAG